MAIRLLGVTLFTRAIGPNDYDVYVGVLGMQTYLYVVSQLGLVAFLVPHGGTITDTDFDQACTLLAVIGIALWAIAFVALPTVEAWIGIQVFAPVVAVFWPGTLRELWSYLASARSLRYVE